MFDPVIERLHADLEVAKNVLAINEFIRQKFYLPTTPEEDRWIEVRRYDPSKLEWQVFDHCAMFTRLYAIFEQFVDELASEYIRALPNLYDSYWDLPSAVINQHRVGVGQIMTKLGREGPYREVEEEVLVRQISSGIRGERPYAIVAEAFFVDRQNYRLERLVSLFTSLGVLDLRPRIEKDIRIRSSLMELEVPSVENALKDFIDRRNEAAHTEVSNIVAADAVRRVADFVLVLGQVLSDAVRETIWQRAANIGWFDQIATVKEIHYGGRVVIVEVEQARFKLGDEFALLKEDKVIPAVVRSIQVANQSVGSVIVKKRTEVGLTLNAKGALGSQLVRIKNPFERRAPDVSVPSLVLPAPEPAVESEMPPIEIAEDEAREIESD